MVLIIGGGIIGLSIAWKLIQIGEKVLILDKKKLGKEASLAAAGMLAGRMESEPGEEKLFPLLVKGQLAWPKFAQELEMVSGTNIEYKKDGSIMLACDFDEDNKLKSNLNFFKKNKINLKWLNGDEIRIKEPYVSANVVSGIFSKKDHQVNNRFVLDALIKIIKKNKNKCFVEENTEVKEIISKKNQVVAVKTNKSIIKSNKVIVCSGAWTNKIKNISEKKMPIRPLKGQMICLKMNKNEPLIRHVLLRNNIYLVPRKNSDLIIGSTVEEQGYDKTITAGGIFQLLKSAREMVPGIEDLPIVESWCGLRPTSRDDAPIVGPSKKLKGLIFATGHHRNGILLAPLTSLAVKDYFLHGKLLKEFQNFQPDRFFLN
tara:strand:- start:692 stop:1810 length:1119 start_codon:yes stop_codon:yes gene_type:complete